MSTGQQSGTRMRRPHSRGALAKAQAPAEQETEWSATALPSPATSVPERAATEGLDAASPVGGVTVEQILAEVSRQFDLNVEETERLEWLLRSSLLATVGDVFAEGLIRKTQAKAGGMNCQAHGASTPFS